MTFFYAILGWWVFSLAFIIAIIIFAFKRKFYPIFYLISITLYIFTAGFYIDAYSVGKNGIMIILLFSTLLLMALGWYFSKIFNDDNLKK